MLLIDLIEFSKYDLQTRVNQLANKLNELIKAKGNVSMSWHPYYGYVRTNTHTGEQMDMSDTNKGQILGLANNPLKQTNTNTDNSSGVKDYIAGLRKTDLADIMINSNNGNRVTAKRMGEAKLIGKKIELAELAIKINKKWTYDSNLKFVELIREIKQLESKAIVVEGKSND